MQQAEQDKIYESLITAHDAGNSTKAFELALKLANENHASAQNVLATIYEAGIGVNQDFSLAKSWYLKAWKSGTESYVALNTAGLMLKAENPRAARFWFRKAIMLGDGDAAVDYAKFIIELKKRSWRKKALELLDISLASNLITPNGREEALALKKTLEDR
jgi:uncharacterized protein